MRAQEAVEVARRLADELLLPDAKVVDAADRVPAAHLAALHASGLTAATAPGGVEAGGIDADLALAQRVDIVSALAGGCLASAFVWLQHVGALGAVARSTGPAARFAPVLASGAVQAGVAITAVRPPDPLRLRSIAGGWTLTGTAPWVTGWGLVEMLRVAAIDDDGQVRTVLIDVGPDMHAERAHLVGATASATVTLTFADVAVTADRSLDVVSTDGWAAADAAGLALNGALALGVAGRAARFAASTALVADVAAASATLTTAPAAELPAARAACAALAVRAATALAVAHGGRGLIRGSHADRLLREAHLLLAFGSRPPIRAALLQHLGA